MDKYENMRQKYIQEDTEGLIELGFLYAIAGDIAIKRNSTPEMFRFFKSFVDDQEWSYWYNHIRKD